MPARAPSMLLDTIRVGSNTYMGVSRACDEAMAALSSVSRAFECHFKTYRALDLNVSTGIVMGTVPMAIPIDTFKSSAL